MYGGAPLSLGAFRRRLPDADRPYRLPAAEILSPLAFVVANLIILWTGWDTIWKLGISILIGYAILVANRSPPQRAQAHAGLEGASWLIPYLLGMGLIVYISDFGPKGDDALIPFGWDALVVAIWSLVIYYWAMAVALRTEQIEEMLHEVVDLEEEGMAMPTH